jgi:hypothetical protein
LPFDAEPDIALLPGVRPDRGEEGLLARHAFNAVGAVFA